MLLELSHENVTQQIQPVVIEKGSSLFSGPSLESQQVSITADITGYVLEERHMSEHGKIALQAGFQPILIKHEGGFEVVYMAAKAPTDHDKR